MENLSENDMYRGITADDVREALATGVVPEHVMGMSEASMRAGIFLSSMEIARGCVPPRTPLSVMDEVVPIIRRARGEETGPL